MANESYEGTKITEIETLIESPNLDTAKILIITSDNQYLVTMTSVMDYIRQKLNEG